MSELLRIAAVSLLAATVALGSTGASAQEQPFIPDIVISSTIPGNGDLNPYGVAFVPQGFPEGAAIAAGDILVSNFNNSTPPTGTQGTGTTIIKLTPNGAVAPPGQATTFFQGTSLGLTTALGVLRRGFVIVGNVPTVGGVIQPGSLLFLDKNGNQLANSPYANSLVGDPWDMTIVDYLDHATVFVSNVNNSTISNSNGFVTRLTLQITPTGVNVIGTPLVIATGYTVQPNDSALVLGPTGLAFDPKTDTLYVASTADNAIFAVPNASSRTSPPPGGTGIIIAQGGQLRGPLALATVPNGDLITSNGDAVNTDQTHPSEIVELTKNGKFVNQFNVDAATGGAFGIGVGLVDGDTARLAVVDDNANDLIVLDQNIVNDQNLVSGD
jgi:hypothetical protein